MVKLFCFLTTLVFSVNAYCKIGDLVIDGSITNSNSDKGYVVTGAQFDSFPRSTITTTTPWTPTGKKVRFDGVELNYILKRAGAVGTRLKFHALNDYEIIVSMDDVEKYNILLATEMDGKRLKVRDFGPYFLIYPLDEHYVELNTPHYLARFIWQVSKITVLK